MRDVTLLILIVALFATLVYAAPRKHDCSPALIRAISDAYEVLDLEHYDRQAEALKVATMQDCKAPK